MIFSAQNFYGWVTVEYWHFVTNWGEHLTSIRLTKLLFRRLITEKYKVSKETQKYMGKGKKLSLYYWDVFTRSWQDSGHWKSGQKLKKWDKI